MTQAGQFRALESLLYLAQVGAPALANQSQSEATPRNLPAASQVARQLAHSWEKSRRPATRQTLPSY